VSDNPLFDASYRRLFGEGVGLDQSADPFFEAFYRNFLADPEVAEMFRETDMARQVSMLRKSFFQLAAFYVSSQPSAELERLAVIHSRLGIDAEQFERWLDALVRTVSELDPDADLATELAWRWAMAPGLTYLKLFTALPAPEGAA
jgi:truncated hemoglobin YjbI